MLRAGALFIPTPRNSQDNVLPQFTHGKSPATACTCTNGNGNGKVSARAMRCFRLTGPDRPFASA